MIVKQRTFSMPNLSAMVQSKDVASTNTVVANVEKVGMLTILIFLRWIQIILNYCLIDWLLSPTGAGAHFTNNFSITIQMWWKFHFALIQILTKWSLQYLAHDTTAELSWHVPNFVAI